MAEKVQTKSKDLVEFRAGNSSADLMFRLMVGNTVQLSQMADNKAHIMITICAGIIGLSIAHLFDTRLAYAAAAVILSSLISLTFAVFTTMPRLISSATADTKDPNFNILFFGDFVRLPYEGFLQELDTIARDPQAAYRTMARDAYILGKMLATKKYRYLNYSYRSDVFTANAFVQYLSRNYSHLSLSPFDDKPSLEFGASVGVTDRTYGSLSFAYFLSKMYVQPDIKRCAAYYTKILSKNVTLFTIASHTDDQGGKNDQLFFGLNIYFGKGISGNVNYTFKDGNDIAETNLQKNLPTGTGYGFNIDVFNQDSKTDTRGLIQYQNDNGIYGVGYQNINRQEDSLFSVAGGIGYIDGSVFLSRPILDAFAKVNVDGLEGVRVYEFGNEIGKTDKNGNVIIPDFRSFIDNKIDIENRDIPINYSMPTLTQYISPPFRGGSLVKFDITKIQGIGGRVFASEDGKKIPFESGELWVSVKEKNITGLIGRNGEFYIENVPPGKHPAKIIYKSKECHFNLMIPKSEEMWIDIGEITCAM